MKALLDADKYMSGKGVVSSRRNAEEMLCSLLGCGRIDLYLNNYKLSEADRLEFERMVASRVCGTPLQYITGYEDFCGHKILTREGVFIPRPETEVLVEKVVDFLLKYSLCSQTDNQIRIFDLCTGSGNVAISLTKTFTHCKIISSDISQNALDLAKENAAAHQVLGNIDFVKADLFSAVEGLESFFDVIVSNPPYIREDAMADLPLEVTKEPKEALDGGKDGLDFYRTIIAKASYFLKSGGLLALELADDAYLSVGAMLNASGAYKNIDFCNDLNSVPRVVTAVLN
ncbi:MAG: peptide chain release factor N(5)-glutamine methyltransferase [Candidatus Omnitrophota bacterium]